MVAQELVAEAVELVGGDPGLHRRADGLAAWAARRQAARMRSMVSASLTSLPSKGAGAGRSTYSGRAMWAGTGRRGLTAAGVTGAAAGGVTGVKCSFAPMADSDGEYWFNVKLHRVETTEDLSPSKDRLGPYATRAEAERALEKAAQRNEDWDSDPDWNDDAPAAGGDPP